ncbi:splicing factor U2AF 35 kDa subunit [Eurytemora carolleeae]|uniref:splicing factor U2AF 35 kDa subunit n=1 Tax=Eurytemora carolleeae TaxID=1294199 RepID=UPI000C761A00|nr:splicing factor U2AF 35 kDa subunit [Eurytemora carolleeae]|eukprot:XP_023342309.1 splicing factor U2AF 35 kDa subunit-like [Eurytemora affinis]
MAEYLASIFGTEKDKVNCSFFFKMGACTHGDRCSRIHNKPTFSQTMLLQNLYINPQNSAKTADGSHLANVTDEEMQEHYDNFFEDVFVECEDKYGQVEEMNVCDNLGDHLVGNVYVKFKREEDAEKATNDLNNRWFGGRPIYAELTPVTDFREACCRQYETGECTRSGFCNFMHLKPIGRKLRHELYGRSMKGGGVDRSAAGGNQVDLKDELEMEKRTRRRSRSRDRRRDRSRDRKRSRSKDRSSRDGNSRVKEERSRSRERGGRY